MIPARLCFLPKRRCQGSLCSTSLAHISPILLSTSPSLGAICYCRLYNGKNYIAGEKKGKKKPTHIRKWSKPRIEMEELKHERGLKREGPMCEWLRRLFLHERLLFTHPVSVFVSTPLTFLLAACRASGASLAFSQEVKLNCRARLPNDERLRHPGCSEPGPREKMLAFQLSVFFPAFFCFLFFWCQFFQHQGELFFIFLHKYLHPSLGARAPRGRRVDGWM